MWSHVNWRSGKLGKCSVRCLVTVKVPTATRVLFRNATLLRINVWNHTMIWMVMTCPRATGIRWQWPFGVVPYTVYTGYTVSGCMWESCVVLVVIAIGCTFEKRIKVRDKRKCFIRSLRNSEKKICRKRDGENSNPESSLSEALWSKVHLKNSRSESYGTKMQRDPPSKNCLLPINEIWKLKVFTDPSPNLVPNIYG